DAVPLANGLADPEGKRGYVTDAEGGLTCLDLKTGQALWSSKAAARAVALDGARVVARTDAAGKPDTIKVVLFDAAGQKVAESAAITFPDWVNVGLAHGRSFAASGVVHKGELYLRWQARSWYAGGARPTPEVEAAARKTAEGVARVDLKTGKVEMVGVNAM